MNIDIEKLIKKVDMYLTLDEIAEDLSVSKSTIKRVMKSNNIKSKSHLNKKEDVICINCNNTFISLKSENRKFCTHSCSATYTNKNRVVGNRKNSRIIKKCINCDKDISVKGNTFCNRECYEINRNNKMLTLIENGDASSKTCKIYLIEKYGNCCMECGWDKIHPITGNCPIELEHIDGNSENNSLVNLKLLCPNCHSLTPTYKALNLGNGRFNRRERYKDGKSF